MLQRPDLEPLALDVSDCVFGSTVFKQRVHQLDLHLPLGGVGAVRLDVWLTAYALTSAGGYGEPIPPAHVPLRRVSLLVTEAAAVTPEGIVRYRLRAAGLVVDAAGQEITLPQGQDWLGFLAAQDEVLLLQNEWLALVRDTQPVVVRAFAERFVQLADTAPSAFV